jgi:hypothetical protein
VYQNQQQWEESYRGLRSQGKKYAVTNYPDFAFAFWVLNRAVLLNVA